MKKIMLVCVAMAAMVAMTACDNKNDAWEEWTSVDNNMGFLIHLKVYPSNNTMSCHVSNQSDYILAFEDGMTYTYEYLNDSIIFIDPIGEFIYIDSCDNTGDIRTLYYNGFLPQDLLHVVAYPFHREIMLDE